MRYKAKVATAAAMKTTRFQTLKKLSSLIDPGSEWVLESTSTSTLRLVIRTFSSETSGSCLSSLSLYYAEYLTIVSKINILYHLSSRS